MRQQRWRERKDSLDLLQCSDQIKWALFVTYTISKYNQQWNVFSAFNPSKCTHLLRTWSSGQPLCSARGAVVDFLPEPGFEPTTFGLPRVSSTLYPLATTAPSGRIKQPMSNWQAVFTLGILKYLNRFKTPFKFSFDEYTYGGCTL